MSEKDACSSVSQERNVFQNQSSYLSSQIIQLTEEKIKLEAENIGLHTEVKWLANEAWGLDTFRVEVSQLQNTLREAKQANQAWADENQKLLEKLAEKETTTPQETQLEIDIRRLQTELTQKDEQIAQITTDKDVLQSEVSGLYNVIYCLATYLKSSAKLSSSETKDASCQSDFSSSCQSNFSVLEDRREYKLKTVTDSVPRVEVISIQVADSAIDLETPSMIEAISIHEPDMSEFQFVQFANTPVTRCALTVVNSHHKLIKDCEDWFVEDSQKTCTLPELPKKQLPEQQFSLRKKDQFSQASDMHLTKLVTDLKQVTQKMKTFVFGKGVPSAEGENIFTNAVHTSLSLSPPQTTNGDLRAQFSKAQAENIKLWNQLINTQAESTLLLNQLNKALDRADLF